jgi:phage protein D
MRPDNLMVEIGGEPVEGFDADLLSLEVELDDELAGMARLTVPMLLGGDRTWRHLDDPALTIWQKMEVTAGLEGETRRLFAGYVTQVRPDFGPGLDQCRLHVWGMDASVLLDRTHQTRAWPDHRDSEVAKALIEEVGLSADVVDTETVHHASASTVMQCGTNMQLLRRLAARNGFECFVDGDTGYFRPPALNDAPQPELKVHAGAPDGTNVNWFALEVNALTAANVAMSQIDTVSGNITSVRVDSAAQRALGARRSNSFLLPGMVPGLVDAGQVVAGGRLAMNELCQAVYDEGEWFVTGEGEVSANHYGGVLMPRSTVTVSGVGETYSGVYYVTHVTHSFTPQGYLQTFRVKRNALLPTGSEQFSGAGSGLPTGVS